MANCDLGCKTDSGNVDDNEKGASSHNETDASKGAPEPTALSWGLFRCHLCDVSGSGLIGYEEHLDGELHRKSHLRTKIVKILATKKVRDERKEKMGEKKRNIVGTSHECHSDKHSPENSSSDGKHQKLSHRSHMKCSSYFCTICDLKIWGRRSYDEHFRSDHQYEVEEYKLKKLEIKPNRFLPPFYCALCKVNISGPASYDQHIKGRPHHLVKLGKRYSVDHSPARESRFTKSPDCKSPFYCRLCKIETSGPVSYRQHYKGKLHYFKMLDKYGLRGSEEKDKRKKQKQ